MNICPICGKDRNSKAAEQALSELLKYSDKTGFTHNPGGGVFEFSDGSTAQIHMQCNWCDYEKVKKFLEER